MRLAVIAALSVAGLAACSPPVPDSAAGVGEAGALPQAAAVSSTPLGGSTDAAAIAADTAAALGTAPGAPLSALAPQAAVTPVQGANAPVTPVADGAVATASLSDEQNFAAVADRETIASDAARLADNRAQYQVVQPTALPQRPDGSGPSVVAYALATNNNPGQPLYQRSGFNSETRFNNACAKYDGADRAQEAFLDAGGPERDPKGMDPDGDGFACYWDPRPFRAARGGATTSSLPISSETVTPPAQ